MRTALRSGYLEFQYADVNNVAVQLCAFSFMCIACHSLTEHQGSLQLAYLSKQFTVVAEN